MIMKCWLAVDKDGTEKVSNSGLIRRNTIRSIFWGAVKVGKYTKNRRHKWANAWSSDETDSLPYYGATLPKGSIEKLIGKKLTWEDEPFDITSQ